MLLRAGVPATPRPTWGLGWAGSRRPGARASSCDLCSPRFAGAFTLRQRMLNFVQNIQYYMMFEVMEPTWHVLEKNLKSVSSDLMGWCTSTALEQPAAPRSAGSSEGKVLGGVGAAGPSARSLSEPQEEKPCLCTCCPSSGCTGGGPQA